MTTPNPFQGRDRREEVLGSHRFTAQWPEAKVRGQPDGANERDCFCENVVLPGRDDREVQVGRLEIDGGKQGPRIRVVWSLPSRLLSTPLGLSPGCSTSRFTCSALRQIFQTRDPLH